MRARLPRASDRRRAVAVIAAAAAVVAVPWALEMSPADEGETGFGLYEPILHRSPFMPLPGLGSASRTTSVAPTTTIRVDWAEGLYLTGVSLIEGRSVAFVEKLRGNAVEDTYMLRVGEGREGMRVVSIDPAVPSVVLEQAGQSATLTYDKEKPAGARAASAAEGERGGRSSRDRRTPPTPRASPPPSPSATPSVPQAVVPPSGRTGLPSLRSRRRTLDQ